MLETFWVILFVGTFSVVRYFIIRTCIIGVEVFMTAKDIFIWIQYGYIELGIQTVLLIDMKYCIQPNNKSTFIMKVLHE